MSRGDRILEYAHEIGALDTNEKHSINDGSYLMSTWLMYSRSHMEGKIHRQIPSSGTGSTFDHCFKIITPKRTFLVCAPSEEDEIKWLAALQCLVQRKNGANGAVVGGVATMTSGVSGAGAGAGAGAPIAETTSTSSASLVAQAQAPPVTRRASALGIVRKRSVTDAAKEAVDEVERRYHPMSQAA